MMKLKVAFVCIHNSSRSQMAEGWALELGSDLMEIYSAGTEQYHEVKPFAIKVMEEVGINMSGHHPKLLDAIPKEIDILISMGCGVVCPFIPCRYEEDWAITDPSGGPIEGYREARDIIKSKVINLIKRIRNKEIS